MTYNIIKEEMVRTAETYGNLVKETPDLGNKYLSMLRCELNGMIKIALHLMDITPDDFRNLLDLQDKITAIL